MKNVEKNNSADGAMPVFSRREFAIGSAGLLGLFILGKPEEAAAGQGDRVVTVVDSLGRQVEVSAGAKAVLPLGPNAQTLLTTLCPQSACAMVTDVEGDYEAYEEAGLEDLCRLPATGALSPAISSTLVNGGAFGAHLVLDAGIPYEGLDALLAAAQKRTGVPYLFLDLSFGKLPQAYRILGEALGFPERGELLAGQIEGALRLSRAGGENVVCDWRLFYAPRANGLRKRKGSDVQLEAIEYVSRTFPITDYYDPLYGDVDVEALADLDLDVVVFDDPEASYSLPNCTGRPYSDWAGVKAIEEGRYVVSPALIHSWFGSLVFVQSLGVLWLAFALYGAACGFDLAAQAQQFYSTFFGLNRSVDYFRQLIGVTDEAA